MPRFHELAECVGQALLENARDALTGDVQYGDALCEAAKVGHRQLTARMSAGEVRLALRDAVTMAAESATAQVDAVVTALAAGEPEFVRQQLADYLAAVPGSIRRALRRPSDIAGEDPPDELPLDRPEDLLFLLPPRPPRFRPGDRPSDLGSWELIELAGLSRTSETWIARQHAHAELPVRSLSVFVEPSLYEPLRAQQSHLQKIQALAGTSGVVPLRGCHLEADPPYLICERLDGYDLAGLMHDWRWRYDQTKTDQAVRLVKRMADIVGEAHKAGVVHRDLKPSNILLHPTAEERVTLWVRGFGAGEVLSAHALEQVRHGPRRGDLHHDAARGSYSPIYASAQMLKREPADPRDDVYALGVIWYQLLKRDPRAEAPIGHDWPEEFGPIGLTTGQAQLLSSCLATRADRRPKDAGSLAGQLGEIITGKAAVAPKPGAMQANAGVVRVESTGDTGPGIAAAPAKPNELPRTVRNALGMSFVLIPAGEFTMGSPEGELGRAGHESPAHRVTISRPFYLGTTPVTQSQFERLKGKNPAAFNASHGGGPEHPVEQVTWDEAVKFCKKLSELPMERSAGHHYRLPTEAEWEYACRAGTTTAFAFGARLSSRQAHFAGQDASGWKGKAGAKGKTCPVATHPSNEFSLFDMHGNVLEWCADWFDEYYYFESPPVDPTGPAQGFLRVVRGGCWRQFGHECRSAARLGHAPESRSDTIGFRVAMDVPTRG